MNVLIGGAGFVGSRLESELSNCYVLDKRLDESSFIDITLPRTLVSKLNLIEFNPLSNKAFQAASQESIDKFSKTIQDNGFLSLFRRSRGRDINASCGSLANKKAVGNE